MSNNGNNNQNRNQVSVNGSITVPVSETPTIQVPKPAADPLKTAVQLCLRILLRAATYGNVARSHEEDIKLAIKDLE